MISEIFNIYDIKNFYNTTNSTYVESDDESEEEQENISNPWNVPNVSVFLKYSCPECDYMCKTLSLFENHAIKKHELSRNFFAKINSNVEFEIVEMSKKEEKPILNKEIITQPQRFIFVEKPEEEEKMDLDNIEDNRESDEFYESDEEPVNPPDPEYVLEQKPR